MLDKQQAKIHTLWWWWWWWWWWWRKWITFNWRHHLVCTIVELLLLLLLLLLPSPTCKKLGTELMAARFAKVCKIPKLTLSAMQAWSVERASRTGVMINTLVFQVVA